jgi:hypothetical protein
MPHPLSSQPFLKSSLVEGSISITFFYFPFLSLSILVFRPIHNVYFPFRLISIYEWLDTRETALQTRFFRRAFSAVLGLTPVRAQQAPALQTQYS